MGRLATFLIGCTLTHWALTAFLGMYVMGWPFDGDRLPMLWFALFLPVAYPWAVWAAKEESA